MKQEYSFGSLTLRILDEHNSEAVLDFYYRNRKCFDVYEADKPDNFYTTEYISNLLRSEYNAFMLGKFVRFFLFDKNHPDTIIGTVSFSDIKKGAFRSCIVGYKIDQTFQRMGYARKMLTTALKIMVLDCQMHRIEAYISPDNAPSIALAEKLGFMSEGTAYSYVCIGGKWLNHLRYVYIS